MISIYSTKCHDCISTSKVSPQRINLQISSLSRNIWLILIWHSFFFRHIVNYKTVSLAFFRSLSLCLSHQKLFSLDEVSFNAKKRKLFIYKEILFKWCSPLAYAVVWVNSKVFNESIVWVKSLFTLPRTQHHFTRTLAARTHKRDVVVILRILKFLRNEEAYL